MPTTPPNPYIDNDVHNGNKGTLNHKKRSGLNKNTATASRSTTLPRPYDHTSTTRGPSLRLVHYNKSTARTIYTQQRQHLQLLYISRSAPRHCVLTSTDASSLGHYDDIIWGSRRACLPCGHGRLSAEQATQAPNRRTYRMERPS